MTDPRSSGSSGSDDSEARRQNAKRQGLAYQAAFEAVLAILIAAGFGYWADTRFGTTPWCLLAGTAFGFAAFVLRLVRLGRQLQELPAESGTDLKS